MSDELKLDGHKMMYHPTEAAKWLAAGSDWERVKTIYPLYVEFSPFGGCNYRCTFCAKDFLKYEANKIAPTLLKQTLSLMAEKGVKSVMFAGEGEPLLYRELGEILDHCGRIGLDAALSSNMAVDNRDAIRSAALNCQWIRASINAGTAAVHAEVHSCGEDRFERVFANLAYAVGARNEAKSPCVLGAQAVLLRENRDTMVELARRCRETGLDYLTIKPYSQHGESLTRQHDGTDYGDVSELAAALRDLETERFKVHFRSAAFARAKTTSFRYETCYSVPMFWAYVRATGDVIGCNSFMLDPKFHYGNINEAGFDAIWEGPKRQAAFEYMTKAHDISRCRVNCRMDKVNEYLWDLKNPPRHMNFI